MTEPKIEIKSDQGLMIFHEIVLLAFDDKTGKPHGELSPLAVTTGILAELALAGRIKIEPDGDCLVHLVDSTETGCKILDRSLNAISFEKTPKPMSHWIQNVLGPIDAVRLVAQELCHRGILEKKDGLVMWTFLVDTYPEANPKPEQSIKARLSAFLFEGQSDVDERTVLLASLANVANLLEPNFGVLKVAKHQRSIDELIASCESGKRLRDVITAIRRRQEQIILMSVLLMSAL